jgi:cyclopropane fatty-acyl-phospholipid synthase-like methyltransferase
MEDPISFASNSRPHDVPWLPMCSVEAVENIGAHYVPTLLKWRETFNEKQE